MDHTYLRYECADSFGLTTASAASKTPPSNGHVRVVSVGTNTTTKSLAWTTAGSHCTAFNLQTGLAEVQLAHREPMALGTGLALNSSQVTCLDVSHHKIATGWVDGAVRVFDVTAQELTGGTQPGLAHSLLEDDAEKNEFVQREPLVLNGHSQAPVRAVAFDPHQVHRLVSGGSDGTVILWDVVAETGLFRLLGHRGGITDVLFLNLGKDKNSASFDGLVTSSLDGLVKVWDLQEQCCTQTIANHRGEVWGAAGQQITLQAHEPERWRLITGGNDGIARVWSVQPPKRQQQVSDDGDADMEPTTTVESALAAQGEQDDVCFFMGRLLTPPNVATSSDKILCVHFHPHGRYVGILRANSKNVDVYLIRGTKESLKKRQRRLKRRQEKEKKKSSKKKEIGNTKKRGILDDPSDAEDDDEEGADMGEGEIMDPELLKASDEFEYLVTVRATHKVAGFSFVPTKIKGEMTRIVCSLSTNALETHFISRRKEGDSNSAIVTAEKLSAVDMHGHPTGIRAVSLSSDDRLACTVSKNSTKIWNVASRTCIQSLAPAVAGGKKTSPCYGLCAAFLPGNTHVVVGTREGHILLIDISAGDVVYCEESAHSGAVWSIDVRRPTPNDPYFSIITGSADKTVKFWDIEAQDEDDESSSPMVVHTRTLEMSDDVIAVRYSYALDRTKLLIFVSTLDCTVKVFFEDSLKMFLSLYGHKLPVLAMDASDDDVILATSGADKTVKIFGLDFGDTHRTLHGHEDSVTDLRFVKRTHNFFTCSKDGTVRYWDGDRFEQILLMNGHFAEINSLAVSRTGAFVLSGGMDRQVRVWERTKDIVFLEEERERELEQMFDRVNDRDEGGTANVLNRKRGDEDDDDESTGGDQPQSEAAVRRSVLSVSAGDRIMEGLERADQETKDISLFKRTHGPGTVRNPNPMLLNMEPAHYVLWVLKTIKSAELEQSLLVLPITHLERLMFYMILLLKSGRGVELCSRVAIFMVKAHQNQIIANRSMAVPLRELRRLIRQRVKETRDIVGYDLAAMKMITRAAQERKEAFAPIGQEPVDIWAGLGLGSDVAAALQSRGRKRP